MGRTFSIHGPGKKFVNILIEKLSEVTNRNHIRLYAEIMDF
jgi:hypothetical protein